MVIMVPSNGAAKRRAYRRVRFQSLVRQVSNIYKIMVPLFSRALLRWEVLLGFDPQAMHKWFMIA